VFSGLEQGFGHEFSAVAAGLLLLTLSTFTLD